MKKWMLSLFEKPVDQVIVTTSEVARSVTHEAWQYASQLTNGSSVMLLGILHKPALQNYINQQHRIRFIDAPPAPPTGTSPFASIVKPSKKEKKEEKELKEPVNPALNGFASPNLSRESKRFERSDSSSIFRNSTQAIKHEQMENRNETSPKKSLKKKSNKQSRRQLSISNSRFEHKIPNQFSPPSPKRTVAGKMQRSLSEPHLNSLSSNLQEEIINDDDLHLYKGVTTGLLEDLRLFQLTVIDWCVTNIRWCWHSIFATADTFTFFSLFSLSWLLFPWIFLKAVFGFIFTTCALLKKPLYWLLQLVFDPAEILAQSNVDTRTKEDIVRESGYPYELHSVTTEDGYIITLERLPNPESKRVLYFQHGLIDSGFTWLASGNASSIAMAAYDNGYDVFLGNFRGIFPTSHVDPNIKSAKYWDFTVNDHAWKDIPAFVNYIQQVKRKDLGMEPKEPIGDRFVISAVAHSMGGMATIMYMINCGLQGIPHGFSKAVLLSPAGVHFDSPPLARYGAPLIDYILRVLPFIHSLQFPSDLLRLITSKIFEDVKSTNPTRDLFTFFATQLVGGSIQDHSLNRVNMVRWVFAGTPVGVFRHFRQCISSKQFRGFDYGKKKNMQVYGTPEPVNFLNHYNEIDIPVYFMMGLLDNLIRPANVIAHFDTLMKAHPNLAYLKAFANAGHIDFTLGVSEEMTNVILSCLDDKDEESPASSVTFHSIRSSIDPTHV